MPARWRREDAEWDRATLREGLQVISEESDRLNALINNLLDASRIQAGGFTIERADVDLPEPGRSRRRELAHADRAPPFRARLPGRTFPDVEGDEERLRQVLNNLLSNAIKYSPEGGEVRVGGWREGDQVTVYVADQGIGIPEERTGQPLPAFLPRRFQPAPLDAGRRPGPVPVPLDRRGARRAHLAAQRAGQGHHGVLHAARGEGVGSR